MKKREVESSSYNFKMSEVFNFKTGKIEAADYWLSQTEEIVYKLRRRLKANKISYGCPICKTPVIIKYSSTKKPFFSHQKRAENVKCILCDDSDLTKTETNIQRYNYNKESEEHKRLKKCIFELLKITEGINLNSIKVEKTKKNIAISTEWKKPDIQCQFKDFEIVFEIQICQTWLSDIIERDKFYKKINNFIFWVFNSFDIKNKNITQSDIFYNNPGINIFVFDTEAEDYSNKKDCLYFKCLYQIPVINLDELKIEYHWREKFLTLQDIKFDNVEYLPYYYPFPEKRNEIEKQIENFKSTGKKFSFDDSIEMKIKTGDYKEEFVSADYSNWSDEFWALVLFQSHFSKNKNSLLQRINKLKNVGLNIEEKLIDELEVKGFIKKATELSEQIHYQIKKIK
jgi:competence CoiA-like predicted nuclease